MHISNFLSEDDWKKLELFFNNKLKTIEEEYMYSQLSIDYCQQMVEIGQHTNSRIVNQCLQYIERHIQDKITIDDLAKYCNLSKRTIIGHFSEYFHMPAEYILQLKLKTAAYLLKNSTFSIVEISNQLSFSSQSHFSVAFKKRYHYTPQQYRLHSKISSASLQNQKRYSSAFRI